MAGNPENGERMAAFMHSQTKGHSHSHTKLVNLITRLYKQNRPQWYYPAVRCTKILSAWAGDECQSIKEKSSILWFTVNIFDTIVDQNYLTIYRSLYTQLPCGWPSFTRNYHSHGQVDVCRYRPLAICPLQISNAEKVNRIPLGISQFMHKSFAKVGRHMVIP